VKLAAAFVRVSTGSQDEASQIKAIDAYAAEHDLTVVKTFRLKGYSASKGTQEPALREAVEDIARGDYGVLVVTDSSRLDRREDLDAQAEILLAIRSAGGDIISIAEPTFGKTDFAGRIVTLVAQHANAEKSRTVKDQTYRGISMIRDNNAHHGPLPAFWGRKGERYSRQAYCTDPKAVKDIYERVSKSESLMSIAQRYDLYPNAVKTLVRMPANHAGVIECSWTHDGKTERWTHSTDAVVESSLWWSANKVLDANMTDTRGNKGGRPVARPESYLSGVLDCPECGGALYIMGGLTPAKDWRTGAPRVQRPRAPKLRCGGKGKKRMACRRFTGCDAQPVIDQIESLFGDDPTALLAYTRVSGNAHELDALKASLAALQARLSATDDDDALDTLVAERRAVKARIESFEVIPDSYDYAETGHTVASMWLGGDDVVKRGMLKAVKAAGTLGLVQREGAWVVKVYAPKGSGDVVDLGGGICFKPWTGTRIDWDRYA
jgi:DNA invertase Pin-like site-specific DNA recombinase